jgi:hypothetical protein
VQGPLPEDVFDPQDPRPEHRQDTDVRGIRSPLLISGIFNLLVAIPWTVSCVASPVGLALGLLGVCELILYARLDNPAKASAAYRNLKVVGILEICTILAGNLPSMICGIYLLVNVKRRSSGESSGSGAGVAEGAPDSGADEDGSAGR